MRGSVFEVVRRTFIELKEHCRFCQGLRKRGASQEVSVGGGKIKCFLKKILRSHLGQICPFEKPFFPFNMFFEGIENPSFSAAAGLGAPGPPHAAAQVQPRLCPETLQLLTVSSFQAKLNAASQDGSGGAGERRLLD